MIKIGIICEYNPFHLGHKRQIEALRERFDEPVSIISLMSGNYVERGDFAIIPKEYRAMAALESGSDLVLELPYPYSGACAEVFAYAGVYILSSVGADYIAFGSECGDISSLEEYAQNSSSELFSKSLAEGLEKGAASSKSYAKIRDDLYFSLYGKYPPQKPNDILGAEYLRSIKRLSSSLKVITVKREGIETASGSRAAYLENDFEKLNYLVPQTSFEMLKKLKPVTLASLEKAIITRLRLSDKNEFKSATIADLPYSLAMRLFDASQKCTTLEELLAMAATKKYTNARIRRGVISFMLSLTPERLAEKPSFTRLLAANEVGRELLSEIDFPVLTRASQHKLLDKALAEAVEFSNRADSFYALADSNERIYKPYIK